MSNRENVPLVFLIVAALAAGGLRVRNAPTPDKDPDDSAKKSSDAAASKPDVADAFELICRFLPCPRTAGAGSVASQARQLTRDRNVSVGVLVATVPDPVESQLDYLFDRSVESLRRAFQAMGFRFASWASPWPIPKAAPKGPPIRTPGVILFHDPGPLGSRDERLYVVFLVGESPVGGLNLEAFAVAMDQAAQIRSWNSGCPTAPFHVLGPYFSGTSRSLKRALEAFADGNGGCGETHVRVVSGSATNPKNKAILESASRDPRLGISFSTTVHPDDALSRALMDFLHDRGVQPTRVAILTEENTAYGDAYRRTDANTEQPLTIPFPLHISQVRSAHAKDVPLGSLPESTSAAESLSLPLDDAAATRDTIAPMSRLSPVYAEIVLNQILSTISRQRIRFVGLAATDVRDKLFLGKQIALNCPGVILLTFESEILYCQPRYNPYLRGMLVASTYPLLPRNQVWTRRSAPDQLLQFSSGGGEGTYNAALLLLGTNRAVVEYGWPFPGLVPGPTRRPPVWITVVGNRSLWPMAVALPRTEAREYVQAVTPDRSNSGERARRWLLPSRVSKLVVVVGLAAAAFVTILYLTGRVRGELPAALGFFGAMLVTRFEQKRLFAFLFLGALSAISLVLGALYLFPYRFEARPGPRLGPLAASASIAVVLTAFLMSAWSVIRPELALARGLLRKGKRFRRLADGIRKGFPAGIAFSLLIGYVLVLVVSAAWSVEATNAFLWERATNPISGVSPLVPFLLLTVGCLLNALCHMARLTLVERLHASSPFRRSDLPSARALAVVEEDVGLSLVTLWPTIVTSILVVLFLALSLTRLLQHVFTELDGLRFARLFEVSFFLLFLGVVLAALRFVLIWRRLRVYLGRLASHPIASAFDRLPAGFRRIAGYQSFGRLRHLAELSVPVEQARFLSRTWHAEGPAIAKRLGFDAGRLAALGRDMAVFDWAERDLAKLFGREASDPKLFSRGGSDVVPKLNVGAQPILEVLDRAWQTRPAWLPSKAEGDAPADSESTDSKGGSSWIRSAEDLVAMQTALFLNYVFVHMWNLIAFYAVGALLIFAAVISYPYQPARLILNVLFVLIACLALLTVALFVQMDRDEILSRISKTVPGKINWDLSFVSRVFVYGVLPIVGLIAARVPEIQTSVAGWLDSLARVMR